MIILIFLYSEAANFVEVFYCFLEGVWWCVWGGRGWEGVGAETVTGKASMNASREGAVAAFSQ